MSKQNEPRSGAYHIQEAIKIFRAEALEHSASGRFAEAQAALRDAKELDAAWERIENGNHQEKDQ